MSRNTGTFNFAANFEVLAQAPLDAKQLVGTYADLTNPATWNGSGSVWLYNGAIVSVSADPSPANNGIYWLCDKNTYTSTSSWIKAGSGSGGTITGATNGLTVSGANIKLGGVLTGATVFTSNTLNYGADYSGLYTARSLTDKGYVDSVATGLYVKQAVNVATTTSNITLSGLVSSPLDGVTLQNGWRVLVKNQVAGWQNGIYVVNTGGAWNRSSDMDFTPTGETVQGSYMYVLTGSTNEGSAWVLTTPDPIVSGDTLTFQLFNHVADIAAGTGITITTMGGTHTISVNGASLAGNSITWNSGGLTFDVNVNSGTLSTALNAKTTQSNLATYTGSTATALNLKTTQSNLAVYTGTTATALSTKTTQSNLATYTGSTATAIGLKTTQSNLATYTGATATLINSKASQASIAAYTGTTHAGGSNRQVQWNNNGVLSGCSLFCYNSGNQLIVGTVCIWDTYVYGKSQGSNFNVGCDLNIIAGGGGSLGGGGGSLNLCGGYSWGSSASGIALLKGGCGRNYCGGDVVVMGGDSRLTNGCIGGNVYICSGTGDTYGNIYLKGLLNKTSETCAVYINGSGKLVTGLINLSGAITGASNGITKTGQNITLGGALTQNTTISGSSIYSLSLTCLSGFALGFCTGGGIVTDNTGVPKGLRYANDYCAGYVNRSLVDAGYVTGYTLNNSNVVAICMLPSLSDYYVTPVDQFIGASGGTVIYLPVSPSKLGQKVSVADISGDALTNIITICGQGKKILDSYSASINSDYGSLTFIWNGIFWSAIAFNN